MISLYGAKKGRWSTPDENIILEVLKFTPDENILEVLNLFMWNLLWKLILGTKFWFKEWPF